MVLVVGDQMVGVRHGSGHGAPHAGLGPGSRREIHGYCSAGDTTRHGSRLLHALDRMLW
jgi:hypothetical protein